MVGRLGGGGQKEGSRDRFQTSVLCPETILRSHDGLALKRKDMSGLENLMPG